jgi:hypothetical protein
MMRERNGFEERSDFGVRRRARRMEAELAVLGLGEPRAARGRRAFPARVASAVAPRYRGAVACLVLDESLRRPPSLAAGLLVLLAVGAACSERRDRPDVDTDAGGEADSGVDAGAFEPTRPLAPSLTSCPAGWRETDEDPPTCEPWPEGGRAECAVDEAHFPGEPGCTRIGSSCPEGEWPEGLPAGVAVLHVRAGPEIGVGDGSLESPFGTIEEAMAEARAGTVIALAKGTFEEAVALRRGVTLWGACVAETLVAASLPDPYAGTITIAGDDAIVRNLRVSGERAGVWADSTSATLEGVVVDGAENMALVVAYGASVAGTDLALRETRSHDGRAGIGIVVTEGGSLELSRAVIERNHEIGVAAGSGSTLRLADVAILDTRAQDLSGRFGRGLHVYEGGVAELERAVIEGNLEGGAIVMGAGTSLRVTDAVVRDTGSRDADGTFGRGLDVGSGASVELTRVLFERNRDVAVFAHEPETIVTLTDVVVRHTLGQAYDDTRGLGLLVEVQAEVQAERVDLEDNQDTGILVRGAATTLWAADVAVRDTRGDPEYRDRGVGLEANSGAVVDLTRARFERNRSAAVIAFDADTTMLLTEIAIIDTLFRDCAVDVCADASGGLGVVAMGRAAIDLRRFVVATSALCGVQVADDGSLDLHEGEIRGNPIGANVQVPDYDFGRLSDGVVYHDNLLNLDATEIPVPTPSDLPSL